MTNTPLKNYGFNYQHAGKEFAFDVFAASADEAQAKVRAMAEASFVGELHDAAETPLA